MDKKKLEELTKQWREELEKIWDPECVLDRLIAYRWAYVNAPELLENGVVPESKMDFVLDAKYADDLHLPYRQFVVDGTVDYAAMDSYIAGELSEWSDEEKAWYDENAETPLTDVMGYGNCVHAGYDVSHYDLKAMILYLWGKEHYPELVEHLHHWGKGIDNWIETMDTLEELKRVHDAGMDYQWYLTWLDAYQQMWEAKASEDDWFFEKMGSWSKGL